MWPGRPAPVAGPVTGRPGTPVGMRAGRWTAPAAASYGPPVRQRGPEVPALARRCSVKGCSRPAVATLDVLTAPLPGRPASSAGPSLAAPVCARHLDSGAAVAGRHYRPKRYQGKHYRRD